MGCRELQIHDYFRFTDDEKPLNNGFSFVTSNDQKKSAYNRFFHNGQSYLGLKEGQVLWIIQNDATKYKTEANQAVSSLAGLDIQNRIVTLTLKSGRQTRPPKYGELAKKGDFVPYVIHLKANNVLKDICWDRVYATNIRENTTSKMPVKTPLDLMWNRDVLGAGTNWNVVIYTLRVKEAFLQLGINSSLWVKSLIKHELVHSVGVKGHIKSPRNLMQPSTGPDDDTQVLPVLPDTKEKVLEGFGL